MKKTDAVQLFKEEILPGISKDDKVAIRCAWLDFTDFLNKDGQITDYQRCNWSNPFYKED